MHGCLLPINNRCSLFGFVKVLKMRSISQAEMIFEVERITLKATEFAQCLINGALFSFDDFDFSSNELSDQ